MAKYIKVNDCTTKSAAMFTEEFDTADEAVKAADHEWYMMTSSDKKSCDVFYVLESVNPDVEAEDHFDGDYVRVWKSAQPIEFRVSYYFDDADVCSGAKLPGRQSADEITLAKTPEEAIDNVMDGIEYEIKNGPLDVDDIVMESDRIYVYDDNGTMIACYRDFEAKA